MLKLTDFDLVGRCPLILTSSNGFTHYVYLLIEADVYVKSVDKNCYSVLMVVLVQCMKKA